MEQYNLTCPITIWKEKKACLSLHALAHYIFSPFKHSTGFSFKHEQADWWLRMRLWTTISLLNFLSAYPHRICDSKDTNASSSFYKKLINKEIESLTCCTALSARSANSTDRPFKACFRVPHVLLFKAAQEGSGVVSEPKALGEQKLMFKTRRQTPLSTCTYLQKAVQSFKHLNRSQCRATTAQPQK